MKNTNSMTITSVPGIMVGQVEDVEAGTGCTVIVAKNGAVGGVDVRGSAPGTRETDLLNPVHTVERVHAVVLSGGSAYGLSAAGGVMQALEEMGIGLDVGVAKVPIVPAAVLFDLAYKSATVRPDEAMGNAAAKLATSAPVKEGSVGAGCGATVGKLLGMERASKGGIGSYAMAVGELIVGAIVAVNALGEVINPENGEIIAGIRQQDGPIDEPHGAFIKSIEVLKSAQSEAFFGQNTTIGCIATNAKLSKAEANKVAQMAHDGLAKTIRPVHTPYDGDTLFALSTGDVQSRVELVGALAVEVIARSVVNAVQSS